MTAPTSQLATKPDARRTGGLLAFAAIQSIFLGLLGIAVGFGMGTVCTNDNRGGFATAPCNVIDRAVKANVAVQAFALLIALAALIHGRRMRASATIAIAMSLAGFAATMVWATSY